jgi:hypothetical protein
METIELRGFEDGFFEDYLKNFIMENEKLDKILMEYFPKDINKIIFSYSKPYCELCSNCCNVCKLYCSLECLRYNNRDLCCKGELTTVLNSYQ